MLSNIYLDRLDQDEEEALQIFFICRLREHSTQTETQEIKEEEVQEGEEVQEEGEPALQKPKREKRP